MKSVPRSIYGLVDSWRLGKSLGVDILSVDSICSFECVYCQLGKINRVTTGRRIFVSTEKLLRDFDNFDWRAADVITFSGSGEPTLAKNLGEAIREIKRLTGKPVAVLTNSSLLYQKQVRRDLNGADRIFCKLDAWSETLFQRVNRPVKSLTLDSIIKGIKLLSRDFRGFLAVQTMLLRAPKPGEIENFARLLREIKPAEIQLNLPLRPIPPNFATKNRGNLPETGENAVRLKTVSATEMFKIQKTLAELIDFPVRIPHFVG